MLFNGGAQILVGHHLRNCRARAVSFDLKSLRLEASCGLSEVIFGTVKLIGRDSPDFPGSLKERRMCLSPCAEAASMWLSSHIVSAAMRFEKLSIGKLLAVSLNFSVVPAAKD